MNSNTMAKSVPGRAEMLALAAARAAGQEPPAQLWSVCTGGGGPGF